MMCKYALGAALLVSCVLHTCASPSKEFTECIMAEDSIDSTESLNLLQTRMSVKQASMSSQASESDDDKQAKKLAAYLPYLPEENYEQQGPVMHRFCEGGQEFNLCSIKPVFWSTGAMVEQHVLALESKPFERKGNMCLQLTSVVAQTPEECRNYENAFKLLVDAKSEFNLTNYQTYQWPHLEKDFWVLAPWSPSPNGNHFVMGEFHSDVYDMGNLDVPDGGLVLDVGANMGIFSIYAAKLYPNASAVAFEAQPLNYLLAVHNVAYNGLADRVKVLCRALASHEGTLRIDYDRTNPGGSQAQYDGQPKHHAGAGTTSFDVPTTTFTNVLNEYDKRKNGIVFKLDCEGCEWDIFSDMHAHEDRIRVMRGEFHAEPSSVQNDHSLKEAPAANKMLAFFKKKDPTFICSWCEKEGVTIDTV